MSIKRHLTVFALAFAVAALTGSALAAPPSTPPGQEKKAEAAAEPAVTPAAQPTQAQQAPATAPAQKASAPGHQKKAAATSEPSSHATTKSQGVNSTSSGVKPSSTTSKNTSCSTGGSMPSPTCAPPAGTDGSKRYGDGTTAAQVATGNGAPSATEIRGPGNSQPHKVCGPNGHWVDVHSVKDYTGWSCSESSTTAPPTTATVAPTTVSCPTSAVASTLVGHQTGNGNIVWISPNESSSHFTHGDTIRVTFTLVSGETCTATVATPTVTATTPTVTTNEIKAAVEQALGTSVVSTTTTPASGAGVAAAASSNAPAAGGVAGVQATQTSGGGAGGVLGAFGVLGQAAGGTLPFTGFPLWLAVVIAIALIAIGWTLWHRGRPAATRDVV